MRVLEATLAQQNIEANEPSGLKAVSVRRLATLRTFDARLVLSFLRVGS